jgi:lipase chaperone LimK
MDSKQIQHLLEKYWNCETTLEEEQSLRDYFQSSEGPDSMKETAELFRYFGSEKNKLLSENFNDVVTKQIRQRQGTKVISMVSWVQVARVAAGILVVIVAGYFIRQEIRKSYPSEVADTYSDPKLAFEETKKALQMISKSFGKAKQEATRINMFNEAEKKIQGKNIEEKKEATI